MSTQTAQPTVLDDQTVKNLKQKIQDEFITTLNSTNFNDVLKQHGVSSLKFELKIDLTNNSSEDHLNQIHPLIPNSLNLQTASCCSCICWSKPEKKFVDCPCD